MAAIVTLVVPTTGALAQGAEQMSVVRNGAAIHWQPGPPSLPKGSQLAVLSGDPDKPGPFVLRVKFPPNSVVGPHTYATAENLTVLTGTFYQSMGEKLDRAHGERMGPGGFVYLPGNMPHSVWTTATESVVQVTGTGPFGLNYVNPADDPGKAH
jgi:hypothetical protein